MTRKGRWWGAPLLAFPLLAGGLRAQPTRLVADLRPGPAAEYEPQVGTDLSPAFASAGGKTFFIATDAANGTEVWVTDGTPQGTRLVRDVFPGPDLVEWPAAGPPEQGPTVVNSAPAELTAWNGTLFFAASSDPWDPSLLFGSDGTPEGTRAVAAGPRHVRRLVASGGALFAIAEERVSSRQSGDASLWATDGTGKGTRLLRSFPDVPAGDVGREAVAVGGRLYFSAWDPAHGTELWTSDGTEEGTRLLLDAVPGPDSSYPSLLPPAGSGLHLFTRAEGTVSLWHVDDADGTAVRLARFGKDSYPGEAAAFGGAVVFSGTFGDRCGLYRAEGRGVKVRYLAPLCAADLAVSGARLLFAARDEAHGSELWVTDGTAEGTRLAVDLVTGEGSSFPSDLTPFGDGVLLFVAAGPGPEKDLLFTDGTGPGTRRVWTGLAAPSAPFVRGSDALFWTHEPGVGSRLLLTDGTAAGTSSLLVTAGPASSDPASFVDHAGRHLFVADDGVAGREVWESDGTPEGTRLAIDVAPGPPSSRPDGLVTSGKGVYFVASDGAGHTSLFRSDGTPPGTGAIFSRPAGSSPLISGLLSWARGLAFVASTSDPGGAFRLFVSDGTPAGTAVASDANVFSPSSAGGPVAAGAGLLFDGFAGDVGREPFVSDGVPGGVTTALDLTPGTGSTRLHEISAARGRGFVTRDVFSPQLGLELLATYGTAAGTVALARFPCVPLLQPRLEPVALGGTYFFRGFDPEHGWELWETDGTPAGTRLFADLLPGPESSQPSALAVVGERLLFAASDGVHGKEPWESDGTPAGTRMVDDLSPGPASSSPAGFTPASGRVLFSAYRPDVGRELFALDAVPGQ